MARQSIKQIADKVTVGAIGRPIGALQRERKKRHGLTYDLSLFDGRSIKIDKGYAYHVGGQTELQFNIGFEDVFGEEKFRHGVAFSIQSTRSTPIANLKRMLIPRIRRFNEFLRIHPNEFADLSMWQFTDKGRSENYLPRPIPDDLIGKNTFIFLGTLQPPSQLDIDWVLDDFDRLKPLYDFVEGDAQFPVGAPRQRKGFVWSPGNKARARRRTVTRIAETVEAEHRHNILQDGLFNHLQALHGKENTSGEQDSGNGMPVDVAVLDGDTYTYFEIKTGLSARACIREAVGQLLEYSYWPGAQAADKLVIVGEPALTPDAKKYLDTLRQSFDLPLEYRRFDSKKMCLA